MTKSYYDWELELRTKPKNRKKKNKIINELGISTEDFKRFIKLWKSKNIVF
jgi:hypothetical protein